MVRYLCFNSSCTKCSGNGTRVSSFTLPFVPTEDADGWAAVETGAETSGRLLRISWVNSSTAMVRRWTASVNNSIVLSLIREIPWNSGSLADTLVRGWLARCTGCCKARPTYSEDNPKVKGQKKSTGKAKTEAEPKSRDARRPTVIRTRKSHGELLKHPGSSKKGISPLHRSWEWKVQHKSWILSYIYIMCVLVPRPPTPPNGMVPPPSGPPSQSQQGEGTILYTL